MIIIIVYIQKLVCDMKKNVEYLTYYQYYTVDTNMYKEYK